MPWTRLLVAFLMAAGPALALMVVALVGGWSVSGRDGALLAAALVLLAIGWVTALSAIYSRLFQSETATVVRAAERGAFSGARGGGVVSDAAQRVMAMLADRERQLATLADEIAAAPITDAPELVAQHVVRVARSVTGDGTWTMAVLDSSSPDLLRAAAYDGEEVGEPMELDELHRWASVSASGSNERFVGLPSEGPWGRFMVVPAQSERFRAILLAPWEGRAEPGPADVALLQLIGRHAVTAVEHALLYGTVRHQASEIDRMAAVQRDFLRSVSHDLQTPLTSIRALAAEIRASANVPEQVDADLDMIEHQADRLRRMVAQLLAVSRLEAGALRPRQELFNVAAIVERAWKALRAPDHAMSIEISGPTMLGVGDPDRFEQVAWALLENAVRYSPAGSRLEVGIRATHDTMLSVAVTDHGTGMDAETLARAFEQFYRSPRARDLAPDGSGIGLYAARGLMEAMGGSISLDSALGSGTTVTLTLPAEPIPTSAATS